MHISIDGLRPFESEKLLARVKELLVPLTDKKVKIDDSYPTVPWLLVSMIRRYGVSGDAPISEKTYRKLMEFSKAQETFDGILLGSDSSVSAICLTLFPYIEENIDSRAIVDSGSKLLVDNGFFMSPYDKVYLVERAGKVTPRESIETYAQHGDLCYSTLLSLHDSPSDLAMAMKRSTYSSDHINEPCIWDPILDAYADAVGSSQTIRIDHADIDTMAQKIVDDLGVDLCR